MYKVGTRRVLGLLAGAAVLLGAASTANAAELRVVLGYYSAATQGVFEDMAKDYMSKHPGDDIKIEVISWDNLQQRLTTDIAGGTAPDIAMIGTRWLLDYVKNDIAEPLDGYITPEFKSCWRRPASTPRRPTGTALSTRLARSRRSVAMPMASRCRARRSRPTRTGTIRSGRMAARSSTATSPASAAPRRSPRSRSTRACSTKA